MKCNVLIDYLTFTVKSHADPDFVISWFLGMDADLFQDEPYGLNGYDKVKSFNGIKVCYLPRENLSFKNMGVCVTISGYGCRTFENFSNLCDIADKQGTVNFAFPTLFSILHCAGDDVNITRIDVACDDHVGFLDMDVIVSAIDNNQVNSRLKDYSIVKSSKCRLQTGCTVYIGSPSSDFRIRIYDKAKEQGDFSSHWVRAELVLRASNANAFVANFVNGLSVGSLAAGIFKDKLNFIELDDINISRCTVCGWWFDFIGDVESIHLLTREVVPHCIDDVEEWVIHQIAPALALISLSKGFFAINEIIKNGVNRLSPKNKALLDDYLGVIKARERLSKHVE